ncbi:Fpg/Nei family DNA glycosylase [bacterium]|nr:Fpg/Nei family DNA glycosylase [bacterium]
MPEGHSIHRYARLHRRTFAGHRLRVSSPQGRFSEGASDLDGRVLETVDATGKHLFYRWGGGRTLHVHLGLFGRFTTFDANPPEPTAGTRLAFRSSEATLYLAGPTICDLIDPAEEAAIRDRLGPDPLAGDSPDRLVQALARRRIGIGAALLDQRVMAGIGNVYRAEFLFLVGIHPDVPAREVPHDDTRLLWDLAVAHMRRGERSGRIVTVDPGELGARRRSDLAAHERLYVYHREGEPCRRCGTEITRHELAGRAVWWCPRCQPAP